MHLASNSRTTTSSYLPGLLETGNPAFLSAFSQEAGWPLALIIPTFVSLVASVGLRNGSLVLQSVSVVFVDMGCISMPIVRVFEKEVRPGREVLGEQVQLPAIA